MRVLFVDDDPVIRRLGTLLLGKRGHQVTEAASGHDALAAIACSRPDVIVLDVMMPVMDGPEVLAVLRSSDRTRDIPVVFLSAIDDQSEAERLVAAGAVGLLPKPFDPHALADDLVDLVTKARTSDGSS